MSEGLSLVYKSSVASKDWLLLADQCKKQGALCSLYEKQKLSQN